MRAASFLLLSLWPSLAQAACDTPVPLESLRATLSSQEAAVASLDFPAFDVSFQKMETELPCVDHRLSTGDAARIHRMYGIAFFAKNEEEASAHSFAAARILDPAWSLPESVGIGTPLRTMWEKSLSEMTGNTAPIGLRGVWIVDGILSNRRPVGWPALVQEERQGKIYTTDYVLPGEEVQQPGGPPIPLYAKPLSIAAGATAVVAAGLITGAELVRNEHTDNSTKEEDYSIYYRANALGDSGIGLGVVAVGLAVGAIVSWTY